MTLISRVFSYNFLTLSDWKNYCHIMYQMPQDLGEEYRVNLDSSELDVELEEKDDHLETFV